MSNINVSTPQSFPVHNVPRNNFDSELYDDLACVIYANDPTTGGPVTVIMPISGRIQAWAQGSGTVQIRCDGTAFPDTNSGSLFAWFDVNPGIHTITTADPSDPIMVRRGRKPPG
jgi:hypothetical protein